LESFFEVPSRSSGSGVIISDDGYIVTNNHVIEEASNIEIVMNNNQRYFAKLVGTDPTTDLALLKIRAKNLPFIRYGDSDQITPGEWVLAVGNPFDLNSTVTAGIISAKARNIGILRDRNNLQIESFIQTDAAVNPGNSGGALVNLKGELIGVNTAIATSSGSYQGYSFAIPVSLVKKVMDDLLEFGKVQRGLLGIQIADVNASIAEQMKLITNQGVLVNRVNEGSAAYESGILTQDVIIGINGHPVTSVSELQELVARNRPGAMIDVDYIRNGKREKVKVKLKNNGGTEEIERREVRYEWDEIAVEDVPFKELVNLQLEGGVRVKKLGEGKWKESGIREGFIISHIDKIPIDNVDDLNQVLEFKKGGILIEGYYPNNEKGVYGLEW
jgi:Do/DeqQ family serine protease